MEKALKQGWAILLTGWLLVLGCSDSNAPPPEEVTIEELNAALDYIKRSRLEQPDSVYDLTNLPALQGKVFPVLPEGQNFVIDPEKNQVMIDIDHRPEVPDPFPY